jgi:hypothetical protein
MAARLPIFPLLWIFTAGLSAAGGCGRPTGDADGTPAVVPSQKASQASPGRPAKASAAGAPQPTLPHAPQVDAAARSRPLEILTAAVQMLESRNSVSARIREQVDLFDKELVGSGVYDQQRAGGEQLIRLELTVRGGNQVSSLLQVLSPPNSEGHYLWTHRKLPNEEKLSRIDLVRAAPALQKAENLPGRGPEGPLAGVGGLPRLLRGLRAAFDFTSAEEGSFGRLPAWRLQGQWKARRLAKILPDQKAAIEAGRPPDLSKLPERLPDHVVLVLGKEDLFPYRIEYRRRGAQHAGQGDQSRALVTMELFDVKFDLPLDRTRFIYNPGTIKYSDDTERFISSLRVAQ